MRMARNCTRREIRSDDRLQRLRNLMLAALVIVFRERHAFKPGETIRLMPDAGKSHVFDGASGHRL